MNGSISITRIQGNQDDMQIKITIRDDASGKIVIESMLQLVDYAKLVSGLSEVPMTYDAFNLDKIGKSRERKTVAIRVEDKTPTYGVIVNGTKEYCVDGWQLNMTPGMKIPGVNEVNGARFVTVEMVRWT